MWVLPSALFALLLFCKVQGDSSEGPRQVGGVALEPRSIAAPSGWMENGTEQRLGPASAFLHHARLRPLLGMHCTLALFICIYNTIPYFSVTLLIHFFFIWLACYSLQTSDIVTFFLRCLKEMAKKAHHGEWSALWLNVFLDNLPLSCAFCACIYRLQKFSFKKKKKTAEKASSYFWTKEKASINMRMSPHVVLFYENIISISSTCMLSLLVSLKPMRFKLFIL